MADPLPLDRAPSCPAPPPPATADWLNLSTGRPPLPPPPVAPAPLPAVPGYALEKELGRGGMGVVYLARQEGLDRPVALKMLRTADAPPLDLLLRFRLEAETAAQIRHPHVVQVYEVGWHGEQPFLALEYLAGGTLADRLQAGPLPPPAAAALVAILADAVQAAHGLGIIHRDLKPANVLFDAAGAAKVADFGLARRLDSGARLTTSGLVVGTPAYMAPEQAEGRADVGTAADVYALGAILYECLTGQPVIAAATHLEALREVLGSRPRPPSDHRPGLPRDLEVICLKCLEREPARRYATAQALAEDLHRYQTGETILARPAAWPERAWRWCRRHRVAAALAVAVPLGLVGTSLGLAWALHERGAALAAAAAAHTARAAEAEANGRARDERDRAEAVTRFLKDDLLALTSLEGQLEQGVAGLGQDATVRALLDQAARRLEGRFPDRPAVEADLRLTVGRAYHQLGDRPRALDHLERCYRLRTTALGPADLATLEAQAWLAIALTAAGQLDRALPLAEGAWRGFAAGYGPDDVRTYPVLNSLCGLYLELARPADALTLLDPAVARARSARGAADPHVLHLRSQRAAALLDLGRLPDGQRELEEVVPLFQQVFGPDLPAALIARGNLAQAYRQAGRLPEAVALLEQVRHRQRALLGADHPATLATGSNLAQAYRQLGRVAEAIQLYEEVLPLQQARLGPQHLTVLLAMNNLGAAYYHLRRPDRAAALLEAALARYEAGPGPDHPETLRVLDNLAACYRDLGRPADALRAAAEAVRRARARPGPPLPAWPQYLWGLACAHLAAGQTERAEGVLTELLAAHRGQAPRDDREAVVILSQLGECRLRCGLASAAEPVLREALAVGEKLAAANPPAAAPWQVAGTRSQLGGALLALGRPAEAGPLLTQAWEVLRAEERAIPPPGRHHLTAVLGRLVQLHEAQPQTAAPYRAELAQRLAGALVGDLTWSLLWGWPR